MTNKKWKETVMQSIFCLELMARLKADILKMLHDNKILCSDGRDVIKSDIVRLSRELNALYKMLNWDWSDE